VTLKEEDKILSIKLLSFGRFFPRLALTRLLDPAKTVLKLSGHQRPACCAEGFGKALSRLSDPTQHSEIHIDFASLSIQYSTI
jgi:hypothetical protein